VWIGWRTGRGKGDRRPPEPAPARHLTDSDSASRATPRPGRSSFQGPAWRRIDLASSITDNGADPSALLLMVTKAR
jgi:hypothetical protein